MAAIGGELLGPGGFFLGQIHEGADPANFFHDGGFLGFAGGGTVFDPQFPQFGPAGSPAGNFAISFHASHGWLSLMNEGGNRKSSEPVF
jgi:hypothetical protein